MNQHTMCMVELYKRYSPKAKKDVIRKISNHTVFSQRKCAR